MKICEFSDASTYDYGKPGDPLYLSAHGHAFRMLQKALEDVNQAGLDGKKLSNLRVVRRDHPCRQDTINEIHADVTHRLKGTP